MEYTTCQRGSKINHAPLAFRYHCLAGLISSPRISYFFQELLLREMIVTLLVAWVTLLSGLETKTQPEISPRDT